MNRKFDRFLENYCRELAGAQTSNMRKLAHLAQDKKPRLREPLLLFAVVCGKERYLLDIVEPGSPLKQEYTQVLDDLSRYASVEEFLSADATPKRYAQVLDAFYAQGSDLLESDRRMNELLREKTLDVLKRNGLTRYALCKALKLNTGNVYTYLNGDPSKVSLDTARKIYDFAAGYEGGVA